VEKMLLADSDAGKGHGSKINPGFLAEHGFY
jgi:hypothetical protein